MSLYLLTKTLGPLAAPVSTLPFALTACSPFTSPVDFLRASSTHPLHLPLTLTALLIPSVFTLGVVSGNVSWVDRVWTTFPVLCSVTVAAWAAVRGEYAQCLPRITAVLFLQAVWSIRLTLHTAKRGLYDLKSEDYRYTQVRKLVPAWGFHLIHIFVVAIAQPLLLFSLCLPVYALLLPTRRLSKASIHLFSSPGPVLDGFDLALISVGLSIIAIEAASDRAMFKFQQAKHSLMINSGTSSDQLGPTPYPPSYHPGFPTHGLHAWVRHPNFAAEQLFWVVQALFAVSAQGDVVHPAIVFGPCFALSVLFTASSALTEWITSRKYPAYAEYSQLVGQFLPQETAIKWAWTTARGTRPNLLRQLYSPNIKNE